MGWLYDAPAGYAAFVGTFVEFLEALTIVLAVGTTRSWRDALAGAALATGVLLLVLIRVGDEMTRIPLRPLQAVLGGLTLLFGMRWLRKAMLRAAGVIPLRDELGVYGRQRDRLASGGSRHRGRGDRGNWDWEALGTTFRVTLIEGMEVIFIVLAIGAATPGSGTTSAILGSAAALGSVCLLGFLLRRPIALIPDNPLKLGVGLCLCSLGTLWLGEGESLSWPGGDWSLPVLLAAYAVTAAAGIAVCRRITRRQTTRHLTRAG